MSSQFLQENATSGKLKSHKNKGQDFSQLLIEYFICLFILVGRWLLDVLCTGRHLQWLPRQQ
ncbi:hypothetical protein QYF61_019909 [Mycteria americana]|uniref:Uncharacterized protein n=1 Tax=Mycteria americana TaxID=33587 RepID=A0AAN7MV31_MYCAM|nr:hypothetical protein QYF61_019909 [Mycteria americana]